MTFGRPAQSESVGVSPAHAMKLLEEEEYTRFVEEFEKVPSAVTEGKLLHEQMRLKRRDVRIAVAWLGGGHWGVGEGRCSHGAIGAIRGRGGGTSWGGSRTHDLQLLFLGD